MKEKSVKGFIALVFKAVALAVGVAVVVLSILNEVDTNTAIKLLGIGCASSGVALLSEKGDK